MRFDYAPPAPDSPHPALDLMSPALISIDIDFDFMRTAICFSHPAIVSMHIDFDFMISAIISRILLLIEPAFREF